MINSSLFLLLQYNSSCLSNYIHVFPLDTVSDHVNLNYFCDHICITFYIFIEVLKHALL